MTNDTPSPQRDRNALGAYDALPRGDGVSCRGDGAASVRLASRVPSRQIHTLASMVTELHSL